jgi:hypothetical protein
VGRSPYQSEKRRKELARLKKQEEKRQRRFNKKHGEGGEALPDGTTPEDAATDETALQGTEEPGAAPETTEVKKEEPLA